MIVAASLIASVLFLAAEREIVYFPKGFDKLFEACEYRYTGGQYHDQLFRYRLFVPRNQKPGEKYPLLVWLHGAGENGSDNQKNLRWLDRVLDAPAYIERTRYFILVVQSPGTGSGWFTRSDDVDAAGGDDMLTVTYAILQKTLREQLVDPDRVYLSGVSSGAGACWELAMRHPEVFAAMAPMGSGGGDLSRAARLVNIPIWAFHNYSDSATSPLGDQKTVAAVKKAGGNALLTLTPTDGHDCWKKAFVSYGIMSWLLDQHRGAWVCWTPPGCKSWKWWHILAVPGTFLAVAAAGWYSERRRRQHKRTSAAGLPESESTHGD